MKKTRMLIDMGGKLIVLSGPSGVGKDTIFRRLLKGDANFKEAVTATTREKRPHEVEGVNYFFKTNEQFDELIKNNELLEWTIFDGNRYGTLKKVVSDGLKSCQKIVLVIEVEGALAIKEQFPDSITVFIKPPSVEKLIQRLTKRGIRKKEDMQWRINRAEYEIQQADKYDFVIENDDLEKAVEQLKQRLAKL